MVIEDRNETLIPICAINQNENALTKTLRLFTSNDFSWFKYGKLLYGALISPYVSKMCLPTDKIITKI